MWETIDKALGSFSGVITLITGMGLLLLGGKWLVDGSVTIARRLGMSTLLIGLTIVAFGTSAPELAFNLTAALKGNGDLSFGNVVGSNIANIGLVLGLSACLAPLMVNSRVLRVELPLLIGISVMMVALGLLSMRTLATPLQHPYAYDRLDGSILIGVFVLFLLFWYRMGQKQRKDPLITEAVELAGANESRGNLLLAGILFLLGLGGLVIGGNLAERGAVTVATLLGLSEAVIGLTIVAIATSLPELVTSIIACRKGHADLAVGNVVGSNLFNILLVLGLTGTIATVDVPTPWGFYDLGAMLIITMVLLPIAASNQRRIVRTEGAILLACYIAYMAFTVLRSE
jgi:cation:H+ antiporter